MNQRRLLVPFAALAALAAFTVPGCASDEEPTDIDPAGQNDQIAPGTAVDTEIETDGNMGFDPDEN